ncbi:MAG: GTPase [Alphaproteobacteria bacterium]|nr:MAG: GTPase [Alphaproteobacteria bacterium]
MRLKTFSAKTMKEVMALVRDTMGPDAIIVSVEQARKGGSVRVTAAVEQGLLPQRPPKAPRPRPSPAISDERRPQRARSRPFDMAELKAAIAHHGFPFALGERVVELAARHDAETLAEALAAAFESLIGFAPLALEAPRPLMFIGPPVASKTVSLAKLAAEAVVNGRPVRLITTDTVKSGGAQQLEHYGTLMETEVAVVDEADALAKAVSGAAPLTLIDTCGLSPFSLDELERAVRLLKAADAEPVLVLPAGIDPLEAAEMADIFARMGARRFVATRLDGARRYGSLLTVARGGRLALAGMSRSPYVAEPLETPTPMRLARLVATLPSAKAAARIKERIS